MSNSSPYILFPAAFLSPRSAQDVVTSFDNITKSEYENLIKKITAFSQDERTFKDLQRVVFSANYDAKLQPNGFPNTKKTLGIDLYKRLNSEESHTVLINSETDELRPQYFIQPLNSDEESLDLSGRESSIVYISSPFSLAKAASNIANKGDRPNAKDGYMISYWEDAGYRSVISGQIPGRDKKITTKAYYPASYNQNKKNFHSITLSDHNDKILFDGSHRSIELGEGDDIAIPSLAAFQPSIKFGKNIINAIKDDNTSVKSGQVVAGGQKVNKTSAAGKPFRNGNLKYQENTISPSKSSNQIFNNYLSKGTGTFTSFGVNQTIYAEKTDILDADLMKNRNIEIGGQQIYGGQGNDIIYGFDPLLYSDIQAKELNSSNKATGTLDLEFLNNKKTNINWSPILFAGGAGQDTFILGDIGGVNLQNGAVHQAHKNGSNYYTILGDKDLSDLTPLNRIEKNWGETMSADEYILTATYPYERKVVQKAVNIDYSDPGSSNEVGTAQAVRKGIKAGIDIAKAVEKKFPAIEAFTSTVNFGLGVYKAMQTNESAKDSLEKFYQDEIKQAVVPAGNWNQTIEIRDWDPLDRITIQMIPVKDPNVIQTEEAWNNFNFEIKAGNTTAMTDQGEGHILSMQTEVGGTKPIAYLSGLQSSSEQTHGYKTYNFLTNKFQIFDPSKDITYLGVLSNTKGAESIKKAYKEPNYQDLEISKDSRVFLWNSQGLRNEGILGKYRSAASSMQVGVDTRKFGWYTDLKVRQGSTSDIDLSTSTFNYWDKSKKQWASHSLDELSKLEPNSPLAQKAAKARFTYRTNQDMHDEELMNLSATNNNQNDVEFYRSRDDGFVHDPVTGDWLAPSAEGYEQAALSQQNYIDAFSIRQKDDGSIQYILEDGFKLSPFIESTSEDGSTDYIFAYNNVHSDDPEHTQDSMVIIDDSGKIYFEDTIGGDYDYNDVVLDFSKLPEFEDLIASSLTSPAANF